jgi:hypothetical protein
LVGGGWVGGGEGILHVPPFVSGVHPSGLQFPTVVLEQYGVATGILHVPPFKSGIHPVSTQSDFVEFEQYGVGAGVGHVQTPLTQDG